MIARSAPLDRSTLSQICLADAVALTGLGQCTLLGRVVAPLIRLRSDPFAANLGAFDRAIATTGLRDASSELMSRYGGQATATGSPGTETGDARLFVTNHPGLFDTLAIFATHPAPDRLWTLARPQPMLREMPNVASRLVLVPDEGPGRTFAVRRALDLLAEGASLLLFGAGRIEPDPAAAPPGGDLLAPWPAGAGAIACLAARRGVELSVIPTVVSGVFGATQSLWARRLVQRIQPYERRSNWMTLLQIGLPRRLPARVTVRYGLPLRWGHGGLSGSVEQVTATIRDAVATLARRTD
ncbi:MAG: hypothetical protein U0821_17885 [Chloroflexota bacterium]